VQYLHSSPCYSRPDGKGWERIWFPDNGPDNARLEDVQMEEAKYEDEGVRSAYLAFVERGRFEVGCLPKVPPRREWVGFDF